MKQIKRLYFIFAYVLFILPPFIWGLVELYADDPRLEIQVISLIVNIVVLALLAGVSYYLILKEKLHKPSILEWKYLLLGLTGNTVVYFYTFQNMMNIDKYITVYLILLIVLLVHYFLISHKITEWELWILMPIFLFLDTLHLILWGCPATNNYLCIPNSINTVWLYVVYVPIVFLIFGYYGYKVYKLKVRGFYGYTNIILVSVLILMIQINSDIDEKIIGTLSIAIAFFGVLHFIVSIVNKTYHHKFLLHYIRTSTLLFLGFILSEVDFFKGDANQEILIFMVAATYVSLTLVILKYLLHVEEDPLLLHKTFRIEIINETHRSLIKETYGKVAYENLSQEENSLTLVALLHNNVIGFISTKVQSFPASLAEQQEAYIDIIEVAKDERRKGIATMLVKQTEQHFRKHNITQIRGWSSTDKTEALHLWNKLHYLMSPTTVYYKDNDIHVDGFYFMKKL